MTAPPLPPRPDPHPRPVISQWHHEYGETGVEAAVKKYAPAYTDATVEVNSVGDHDQIVSAKAEDVDAVRAHVKWLWIDRTEDQPDLAQSYGVHIPRRRSMSAKAFKLSTGIAEQVTQFAIDLGRPTSPPYWTGAMGTAFTDLVTTVVTRGADPVSTAAAAARVLDRELARGAR